MIRLANLNKAQSKLVKDNLLDTVRKAYYTKSKVGINIISSALPFIYNKRLRTIAKPNIEFLGEVSEQEKADLFSKCLAFINPQEEDFGITTVEAQAAGRPVIAYRAGGALEIVKAGETGEFIQEQSWEDLANTIIHFKPEKYISQEIKNHAEQFSKARFKQEIKNFIEKLQNI